MNATRTESQATIVGGNKIQQNLALIPLGIALNLALGTLVHICLATPAYCVTTFESG